MPSEQLRSKIAFVTGVSNPARFRRRYELYHKFAHHIRHELGQKLITVECQLGDRPFFITSDYDPDHVQVRSKSEVWHKENLLNIAISRLPREIEYVCWLDSDIHFLEKDIVNETIHALQHHPIVQMWQTCVDLGPTGEAMKVHSSFGWSHKSGQPFSSPRGQYPSKGFAHP